MKTEEVIKNLKTTFQDEGITLKLTPLMLEQFAKFYRFLMDYQTQYNLTRLTSFEEVAIKHFVDCLYVVQLTELPDRLMDMGTGAGFPGIPIKIALPEKKIILVEGVQKKVEYLKKLRDHLGLKNLDIIGRKVDPKMHYPVNGVITRAVEVVDETLKNVSNCLQVGGKVIFMKTPGTDEEIQKGLKEMGQYYKLIQDEHYRLGHTSHERRLVVFQKTKSINAT
ncbi:MAG: 16S rRNA (guanine(527)-N(7))-methyltransferase RsmG [Oligoflexia bacterium]|nr:16S rRNA (guanine(527)-N(7))-methyltransferase RsmG [Oligoflexia bacterium]